MGYSAGGEGRRLHVGANRAGNRNRWGSAKAGLEPVLRRLPPAFGRSSGKHSPEVASGPATLDSPPRLAFTGDPLLSGGTTSRHDELLKDRRVRLGQKRRDALAGALSGLPGAEPANVAKPLDSCDA